MISLERIIDAIPAAADLAPGVVGDMVARATAFVEAQTRRYFGLPVGVTEYLSGNGYRILRLSEPIATVTPAVVTAVEERSYPGADAVAFVSGDFVVRTQNGTPPQADTVSLLVRANGVWANGYEYAVTYGRGYALDAGPKDIEAVILALIEQKVEAQGDEEMYSETVGSYSYTRFKDSNVDLIDDGWETINAWRRTVFA